MHPVLQAANEVLDTLEPVFERDPKYIKVMERLIEPERVIHFRVAWLNDKGEQNINRGYRIQYNGALGPYKGGLRCAPTGDLMQGGIEVACTGFTHQCA